MPGSPVSAWIRADQVAAGRSGPDWAWPLHDTTCGPELVPSFVDPLVVALTMLCLAPLAVAVVRGLRTRGDRTRVS